ncbi:MAG TPA: acetylxylan esterase [Lacunisphaera sp.]|nr:acetylxylan esterase [Lacunisphaera sp.]
MKFPACLGLAFAVAASAHAQPRLPWLATPEEARQQSDAAMAQLGPWLNRLGFAQLDHRRETMRTIMTREQAEQRQAEVRARILALVGGNPKATGPVVARKFGAVEENGFKMERVAFQSCPDYWVTADLYVPRGPGPFPAIVLAMGHGPGKEFNFAWGANLARAGILALAYDPVGQGERVQHFDPELGDSKLERMGEHEHANQSALLVGQSIARYWFADGMRAVDYLRERGDVDATRIGAFGCSGGGTATAYLAAMDPRVTVAAVSSYITSFRALLPASGPQDAEQTLPGFLAAGLDFADWVELAAPRPYAIVAFDQDFFPIAGAVETYDEARGFYGRFDAAAQLALIRGPGGHCNLPAVMPQLLEFLVHHLKGPAAPVPEWADLRARDPDELTVTPTGQVATSLGGKTIEDMVREALPAVEASSRPNLATLRKDIGALTGASEGPLAVPMVRRTAADEKDGWLVEKMEIESEPGIALPGRLARPAGAGPHPLALWLDATPLDKVVALPDFVRLVRSGHLVLALQPRGVLGEPDPNPGKLALGQYMSPALRAIIVGRTLVGLRVDDARRAVAWLASLAGADRSRLLVYGRGGLGMVALHAAVLDNAITEVVIENTLASYRLAVRSGLHRNLSELAIPGVLRVYDTGDLVTALGPRQVVMVNPADAMGRPLRMELARVALTAAGMIEPATHVRIVRRDPRDPLDF